MWHDLVWANMNTHYKIDNPEHQPGRLRADYCILWPITDSKSEEQLSDGAEIVEKPVVLSSSSESDDLSGNMESMAPLVELPIHPPPPVLGGEPSANKDSLAEPVAQPVASSYSPPPSPSMSPRVSNQSRTESPRKHSANILGVGSKLLSRIKHPKGKHSDS